MQGRTSGIGTVDSAGRVLEQKHMSTRRNELVEYPEFLRGPHPAVEETTGSWYRVADLFARLLRAGCEPEGVPTRTLAGASRVAR